MFSNLRRFFSKKTAKQIGIPRKTYGFLHFEEGRNGIFHPKVNLENLEKEMGFIIQRFNDEISNMKANKLSLVNFEGIRIKVGEDSVSILKLGSLVNKDASTSILNLFDPKFGKAALSSIQSAGINLSAILDRNRLIITTPKITRDRREEAARLLLEIAESFKKQIRHLRTTAINEVSDAIKSIDHKISFEAKIQSIYEKQLKFIDTLASSKKAELLK